LLIPGLYNRLIDMDKPAMPLIMKRQMRLCLYELVTVRGFQARRGRITLETLG